MLLTILSSLAQDESRSISENSTWGIRRRFEQGKHKMSTKRFLGYDSDEEGHLIVNRQQAKIVVRLYEEFLSGKTVDYIARIFKAEKIKNWDGKYNWHASTLDSMLRNEKYMGDTILQKSYTADFLSKRRVVNDGDLPKYHIKKTMNRLLILKLGKLSGRNLTEGLSTVQSILPTLIHKRLKRIPFMPRLSAATAAALIPELSTPRELVRQ